MKRIALYVMFLTALAAASVVSAQQVGPPVTNGGGVTASGRQYDYKKVENDKITYFRVLRTREEIDKYLVGQSEANRSNPELVKQLNESWTVMEHEWRRDPVTKQPITKFPPPPDQQQELVEAFKARLGLPAVAADEFQRKLATGDCNLRQSLDPRRLVQMVNGTGVNDKFEIPEELAAKTRSCEFFLESVPVVLNLVLVCGNFGYDFVEVWWESNPTETGIKKPPVPVQANCLLLVDGKTFNPKATIATFPDQQVVIQGTAVGGGSDLQLKSEWLLNGNLEVTNPTFSGSEEFPFGPKVTRYQTGTYNGMFRLTDQFGRQSECPFIGEVRPVPPPLAITPPPEEVPPPVKVTSHKHKRWPYYVAAIGGAALVAVLATRHKSQPGSVPTKTPSCVTTVLPNGTTTTTCN